MTQVKIRKKTKIDPPYCACLHVSVDPLPLPLLSRAIVVGLVYSQEPVQPPHPLHTASKNVHYQLASQKSWLVFVNV